MRTLLVGFDSAWTAKNSGAIVGIFIPEDGTVHELGPPQRVNYRDAEDLILKWQAEKSPSATIIMIDQPTIVKNTKGQRPVENIVASAIGRRRGGVQPASTAKDSMFGPNAPIWPFLEKFGGAAAPLCPRAGTQVFETYPVLALIGLGWTLLDDGLVGLLPKYNPDRRATFSISDWQYVCSRVSDVCLKAGLVRIANWVEEAKENARVDKSKQDGLDACICLLVALHYHQKRACLMIGDQQSGYMLVPGNSDLQAELESRCASRNLVPGQWVRSLEKAGDLAVKPTTTGKAKKVSACLSPDAYAILRSFEAEGRIDFTTIAPMSFREEVSAALPKAVRIVCQIDEDILHRELLAKGVPEEVISSIADKLSAKEEINLKDCGLPFHMRKNPIF